MKWWRAAFYESDIFTLSKVLFITNKSQYPQPSVYIQRRGGGPLLAVMVDINLRLRSPDLRCARARAPPLEALLESGSGICNIVRGKTRSFLHTTAQSSQPHWHCFLLSPNQLLPLFLFPVPAIIEISTLSTIYKSTDHLTKYLLSISKDCSGWGEIQTL